jgi:hypothetical protein
MAGKARPYPLVGFECANEFEEAAAEARAGKWPGARPCHHDGTGPWCEMDHFAQYASRGHFYCFFNSSGFGNR